MKDPRIEKLADSIINYAVELKPGEKILIEVNGLEIPLAQALVRYAYEAGGIPFVSVNNHTLLRELLKGMTEEQARAWAKWDLARMKEMDAFVGLRATENANELADVAGEK